MKNIELFIGLRYFRSKKSTKFISMVNGISIACTAFGVMAIIVVLSVMNGFQNTIRDKIINTGFHVYLTSYGKTSFIYNHKEIMAKILKKEGSKIITVSPFFKSQVMVKSTLQRFMGIDFHGIEKDLHLKDRSFLETVKIINGHYDLNKANTILLGEELAEFLDVDVGDKVDIISPQGGNIKVMGRLSPVMRPFHVTGIFKTGYYEYDLKLAFTSLESMQDLVNKPGAAWGIGIKIKDIYQAPAMASRLKKLFRYHYQFFTWADLNRNLYKALRMEKALMAVIVFLIVVMAAIIIAATLVMMIAEKKKEIAILRSCGAYACQIIDIFTFTGLFIGGIGFSVGLFLGLIASRNLGSIFIFIQNIVNFIALVINKGLNIFAYFPAPDKFEILPKDVYYLDKLPVDIMVSDIIIIGICTFLVTLLFSFIPANQTTKFKPMEIIRYE